MPAAHVKSGAVKKFFKKSVSISLLQAYFFFFFFLTILLFFQNSGVSIMVLFRFALFQESLKPNYRNQKIIFFKKKKSRWLQTAGIRKYITGVTSRVWLMTLTDNHSSQSKFVGTWCSTRISTHIPAMADDIAERLIADVNINRNVSPFNQTECSLQRHLKRGEIQQAIRLRISALLLDRHCFWGVASARCPI